MSEWEHVVVLSADALRADHLSCYGYRRATSPVLDALAGESLRFTNAYSASSHTREAVPALLTGEYPDVAVDAHVETRPQYEKKSTCRVSKGENRFNNMGYAE